MNETEYLLSSQVNAERLLDSIAELDKLKNKRRIELLRYRCALLQVRVGKYVTGSPRHRFATKRLRHSMANIDAIKSQLI